jgi:aldose 1-epimerase
VVPEEPQSLKRRGLHYRWGVARVLPSGAQFCMRAGAYEAVVVQVGAGLRVLRYGGQDLIEPYAASAICDGAHGAVLAPWPNRVLRGSYRFEGVDYQLELTEPEAGNAIHGLVRWRSFELVRLDEDRVDLALVVHPTPGYPFALRLGVTYQLAPDDGLVVTIEAENIGDGAAPVALGQHPYLIAGPAGLESARLVATARLTEADSAKLGVSSDLCQGLALGGVRLDHTAVVEPDNTGARWARLEVPEGRAVEAWFSSAVRYLQLFTGDTLAPQRRRRALAVEPMTAPPNALATGQDLCVLQPGARCELVWGVRAR